MKAYKKIYKVGEKIYRIDKNNFTIVKDIVRTKEKWGRTYGYELKSWWLQSDGKPNHIDRNWAYADAMVPRSSRGLVFLKKECERLIKQEIRAAQANLSRWQNTLKSVELYNGH